MATNGVHNQEKLQVLVIGAGIGGLSASIAIKNAGHDVTILEKVPKLQEVMLISTCRFSALISGDSLAPA